MITLVFFSKAFSRGCIFLISWYLSKSLEFLVSQSFPYNDSILAGDISLCRTSISKDKSKKKNDQNEKEENVFLEKKAEGELIDEINNARKKRRRSSASIE